MFSQCFGCWQLAVLSRDIFAYVPELFAASVRAQYPTIPNAKLQALVDAERPNLLPCATESELTRFLWNVLSASSGMQAQMQAAASSSSSSSPSDTAVISREAFVLKYVRRISGLGLFCSCSLLDVAC